MKLLFITKWLPYPPDTGNPIRNFNVFSRLAKKHDVTVLSFVDKDTKAEDIKTLGDYCQRVISVPFSERPATNEPGKAIKYMLAGKPPDLRLNMIPEMSATIQRLTREEDFDIVQIEDSFMALYLDDVTPKGGCRTVLSLHDINFHKIKRIQQLEPKLARKLRLWLHSTFLNKWEPAYAGKFDGCVTMSELDRERLLEKNPAINARSIPNGVDTKSYQFLPAPLPEDSLKQSLLYIGNMDYRPNQDAIIWFCREILPVVRKTYPQIELWIVGKNTSDDIYGLADDHTHVTGMVPEVSPYYRNTYISIVPLRAGGGTRLKILESMALGRPVVSTTIGCEGIEASDGEEIFIADSPSAFAEKIDRLIQNQETYNQIAFKARKFVENTYDWDIIVRDLELFYRELLQKD